jgi:hypothetical protein
MTAPLVAGACDRVRHRLIACGLLLAAWAPGAATAEEVLASVDEIQVAVQNLEAASRQYRALGFTLKPGQGHDTTLLDAHVRYADGSGLQLITASEARDELAAKYLDLIAAGDGPVFLGMRAQNLDAVMEAFTKNGIPIERDRRPLKVADPRLDYLSFDAGDPSPGDRRKHFRHANRTDRLIGVWLADAENHVLLQVLRALGARLDQREVEWPMKQRALVASLEDGEITILPNSNRRIRGRPVIGAVLRTTDLDAVDRRVRASGEPAPRRIRTPTHESLLLDPELTRGIWLEFRQPH